MELNENERSEIESLKTEHKLFFDQLRNSVKYRIYLDLKNKGFFITTGLKYGADFLLYNGKKPPMLMFRLKNKLV